MPLPSRGPLSWQQTLNLRRNQRLAIRTENVSGVASTPVEQSLTEVKLKLAEIAEREEALRIIRLDADDDEQGCAYAGEIDIPMSVVSVDSPDAARQLAVELGETKFPYDSGPLWAITAIDHPDDDGRPSRTLCLALDHHIADQRAAMLLRDELLGTDEILAPRARGGYRDWVSWQREQYLMGRAATTPGPARDFWRRYFDGGAPNHATIMPFCHPDAAAGGGERIAVRDLSMSGDGLRAAAARLNANTYLFVAASIASAVSASSAETDVTLRYVTHGRTPRVLDTVGWFSDNMALRLRSAELADPYEALKSAATARLEIVEFETTPWGYILEACSAPNVETPQVVLNHLNVTDEQLSARRQQVSASSAGSRGDLPQDLNFLALIPNAERCHIECRFDRDRFDPAGVEQFLDLIQDHLDRLIEAC